MKGFSHSDPYKESTWDRTPKTKLLGSRETQRSIDLLETNPSNSQNVYYVLSVSLLPGICGEPNTNTTLAESQFLGQGILPITSSSTEELGGPE